MRINFQVFLLLLICGNVHSAALNKSYVQDILDNLYATHGDYRIDKPELIISNTSEFVAQYKPGSNAIVIEQKVIDLCENLGDNRDNALAFIIGHELAHAYQSHLDNETETSFLAYNKAYSSATRKKVDVKLRESEADIFGSFSAYLAGYKIQNVFPDIINDIYSTYNLTDKILPQYPSKSSRNKSAEHMMLRLDTLVNMYDAATYLSVTGNYMEASACYDYIEKSYSSVELNNNKSVNYLLEALNFAKLNSEKYFYPIELDLESRLHKAQKTATSKDLSPEERMMFTMLIINALEGLYNCIKQNPNYIAAYINIIAAYTIDNSPDKALKFIIDKNVDQLVYNNSDAEQRAAYEIVKALALQKNGETEKARKLLLALNRTSSENIKLLSQLNIDRIDNNSIPANESINESTGSTNKLKNKLRTKPSRIKAFPINKENTIYYSFWVSNSHLQRHIKGDQEVLIQEIPKSEDTNRETLIFLNKNLRVYQNNDGKLIELEDKDHNVMVHHKKAI